MLSNTIVTERPVYVDDAALLNLVEKSLAEDIGAGDVTTLATIPASTRATGRFLARASGTLAGAHLVDLVFRTVDPDIRVHWLTLDGALVKDGATIARIHGPARGVLTGERVALNLLQRMSGIATATRRMVELAEPFGAQILDTRKTVPGLRLLDKWAVRLGGGQNHRVGLYDMVLIKDNHIAVAGSLEKAVVAARKFVADHSTPLRIEVEVRTLDEVRRAVECDGIDILLLDNMVRVKEKHVDTSMLAEAVTIVGRRVLTEASGNVTLSTVAHIAQTGVDFISSGALTHSVTALDISLILDFD